MKSLSWSAQPVLLQVNTTKACLDASVGQHARAKQWQCNPGAGNHKFSVKRVAKGAAFELRNQHLGNRRHCQREITDFTKHRFADDQATRCRGSARVEAAKGLRSQPSRRLSRK